MKLVIRGVEDAWEFADQSLAFTLCTPTTAPVMYNGGIQVITHIVIMSPLTHPSDLRSAKLLESRQNGMSFTELYCGSQAGPKPMSAGTMSLAIPMSCQDHL